MGRKRQIRLRFWFFQKFHQSSPISPDLGWWHLLFRFLKSIFCQGYRVMYPYFQKTALKAHRKSGCSRNFTKEGAHGLVHPLFPDLHCIEKKASPPVYLSIVRLYISSSEPAVERKYTRLSERQYTRPSTARGAHRLMIQTLYFKGQDIDWFDLE